MTRTYGSRSRPGERNRRTRSPNPNNLAVHIDDVTERDLDDISIAYIHTDETDSEKSERLHSFTNGHPIQAAVLPDACRHYGPYTEFDIYLISENDIEEKDDVLDLIVIARLVVLYSL